MGGAGDRLYKRKRGEELKKAADEALCNPLLRPKRVRKSMSSHHYSEDDEDEVTLKLEADVLVLSAHEPQEQRLNAAPGASGTTSTTDITPLCLPGTKGPRCAGCGSSSHRLNLCLKASPSSGLMKGCPWCNTLEHILHRCPRKDIDLNKKLHMIQMRANMPWFEQPEKWVAIIHIAVEEGRKPPNEFPWTPAFAKKMCNAVKPFQEDLDNVGLNNSIGLPIDPATKDWETVERGFTEGFRGVEWLFRS
ncbi:hypothetical protein FNAPI_6741 [Fusarium napiforme]|uniref:Uncharacterized protein n=1 Tax=Fusarium napiforme TaxID=42672 RepID=A0A8H5N663_9HYPO|nr:hypothetical protein FNAPI_6741 [Fusarium napiforme]